MRPSRSAAIPALLWSSKTDLVYCASGSTDDVSVLRGDGSAVVATLPVGDAPLAMAFSPSTCRLYVGHSNSSKVYVMRDEVGIKEGPQAVVGPGLLRAVPNPFRQKVGITWSGPSASPQVAVYSPDGRLVTELGMNGAKPGDCQLEWDGRDRSGREVPAGVYTLIVRGVDGRTSVESTLHPNRVRVVKSD